MKTKLLSVLLTIAMLIACLPVMSILNFSYDYQLPVEQNDDDISLNALVRDNPDGTSTTFLFNENVKYVDKNGKIRLKSNNIEKLSDSYYGNTENDILVRYPVKVADGVSLTFNNLKITSVPDGHSGEPTIAQPFSDGVVYRNVFGENIDLRYTQTLSGYKEELILNANPDIGQFDFIITAENAELIQKENSYVEINQNNETAGYIGDVFAFDSSNVILPVNMILTASERTVV